MSNDNRKPTTRWGCAATELSEFAGMIELAILLTVIVVVLAITDTATHEIHPRR
jgi:hypothetical protein